MRCIKCICGAYWNHLKTEGEREYLKKTTSTCWCVIAWINLSHAMQFMKIIFSRFFYILYWLIYRGFGLLFIVQIHLLNFMGNFVSTLSSVFVHACLCFFYLISCPFGLFISFIDRNDFPFIFVFIVESHCCESQINNLIFISSLKKKLCI